MSGNWCLWDLKLIIAISIVLPLMLLTLLGVVVFVYLNNFLSKNEPVATDLLIVEGWLPDYALQAAIAEFESGQYKTLITVGASLPRGFYLSEYKDFGELAAATLIAMGFDRQKLAVVSTDYMAKCRTQNAAIALKEYLVTSHNSPPSMNVFTLGPHARRTWLVFSRVFSPAVAVGIIPAIPLAYDPQKWWRSSEGMRVVISELIAYLYRRFGG